MPCIFRFDEKNPERHHWCCQQFGRHAAARWYWEIEGGINIYTFTDEKDAVLFALRWEGVKI